MNLRDLIKSTGILNTVISDNIDIVDIVVIGTVDIVDIDHTIYWHCCSNMKQ